MTQSLLSLVKESLEKNPRVYIVRNSEKDSSYFQSAHYENGTNWVNFCVAPAQDCFDRTLLNQFISSLKNGQETNIREINKNIDWTDSFMVGALTYKEILGQRTLNTTETVHFNDLKDAKLFYRKSSRTDFTLNSTDTTEYAREITVRVYPSQKMAEELVSKYSAQNDWVRSDESRLYQPGFRGSIARVIKKVRGE